MDNQEQDTATTKADFEVAKNLNEVLTDREANKEPQDLLTYDFMCSRIRDELGFSKLNQMSAALGVQYRYLRLIVNNPDHKVKIGVVNDIYKKLFRWNM